MVSVLCVVCLLVSVLGGLLGERIFVGLLFCV